MAFVVMICRRKSRLNFLSRLLKSVVQLMSFPLDNNYPRTRIKTICRLQTVDSFHTLHKTIAKDQCLKEHLVKKSENSWVSMCFHCLNSYKKKIQIFKIEYSSSNNLSFRVGIWYCVYIGIKPRPNIQNR